jgi:hypothetical protein
MSDFTRPTAIEGKSYRSTVSVYEFDCKKGTLVTPLQTYYDGPKGTGKVVLNSTQRVDLEITKGSLGEILHGLACPQDQ